MAKVPAFFRHAGVKLNSIALEFTRSGPAAATISAIAQGETRFGTSQGGTPTSLTFSRISQFQGSIKRAGSPVGNLTGGSVTYSNNLEKIETIRNDGLIERQARERTEAGLALDGLPDLSTEGERDGFYQVQLIRELAVQHIATWIGVELEGGPAPPKPANIIAVMNLYPVGERFFQEFTLRQVLLNAIKNGSGPSAAGTSSRAEGPNIAEPAATTACPAPEVKRERTDSSALPPRLHQPPGA